MSAERIYLDTNILIYVYSNDEKKKREATLELFQKTPIISIQNINEAVNVFFKKFHLPPDDVANKIKELCLACEVVPVHVGDVEYAVQLKDRYGYSYFDSLMLASALKAEAALFYSEDMQHGQRIYDRLSIINPFALV
jgi:predicted nucleic acid-binding protein